MVSLRPASEGFILVRLVTAVGHVSTSKPYCSHIPGVTSLLLYIYIYMYIFSLDKTNLN